MKLLSPAISSLARMRLWRIEAWKNNPLDAQREVLQDLVTSAQYTEFGRRYHFSELFNVRSFKEAVPIHEYDAWVMKDYLERRKPRILTKMAGTVFYLEEIDP